MGAPTVEQVKRWLVGLLPPGADNLYSLDDGDGGIGDYYGAIAEAVKAHGTDLIDTLRANVNPATVVDKLPDWEAANGTSATRIAQTGTTADRQAQLVSRLREYGASTLDNIRAAVQPYFQYADPAQIQIVECDRDVLTSTHTYTYAAGGIPALGAYSQAVNVPDNMVVSKGGGHLRFNISFPSIQNLTVSLESPIGNIYAVAPLGALGTGAVAFQEFMFFVPLTAGDVINGNWTLTITNNSPNIGNVHSAGANLTTLFLEGIGRVALSDVQGLAAEQFLFAVVFDPSLSLVSLPDLGAARDAVRRMQPAHTQGFVVQVMSGGGLCSIVDDAAAVVDGCVVC